MMPVLFPGMTPCMMLDSQGVESFEINPFIGHIIEHHARCILEKIKTLFGPTKLLVS